MTQLRRRRATLLAALLLVGCRAEPRAVGVVVSSGVEAAAEAAAAAPGAAPVRVRAERPSNGTSAQEALDAAERLIDRHVIAVVGHSNSGASLAASQAYNRARVVQIAPTTTATVYERAGEYSFRMVPSDREQARLLVRAAAPLADGRPVVIMYENDEYGYGLLRDVSAAADSLGLRIAGAAPYLGDEPAATLQAVLGALLREQPRVLIFLGRVIPLDSLHPMARAAGVQVIASDGLDTRKTYRNAGDVFTGLYFVRLLDPAVQEQAGRRLDGVLDVTFLGAEGLLTYDAVGLVRAALTAGARHGGDVRTYLMSLGRTRPPYHGVTGDVRFDETRSLVRPWQLARVTADGVQAVEVAR